jgi:hypothetical protein
LSAATVLVEAVRIPEADPQASATPTGSYSRNALIAFPDTSVSIARGFSS